MQQSHPGPHSVCELIGRGRHLHRSGKPAEAESAYRRALALEPENAEALHYLGLLKHQLGQTAMAVELMSRAMALRPDSPEFHYNFGCALASQVDRAEEGMELLARAIELQPDYGEAYASLGLALDQAGRTDDALAAWSRAIELRPAFAEADWAQRVRRPTTPVIEQGVFFSLFGGPCYIASQPRGMVTGTEMAALIALIRSFHCRRLGEFGVGTGANAATILQHCPDVQAYIGVDVLPGSATSLEYQSREVPGQAGQLALGDPRFQLLVRPGGTLKTTPEELAPLDFVFIDGDHGTEMVRHDTNLARRSVKSGIICWHDYDNHPAIGPKTVIDQLNATEGRHICRLSGTLLCFEVRQ